MVIIKFTRDVVELLLEHEVLWRDFAFLPHWTNFFDVIPSPAAMLHFSALAFLRGPPLNKRLITPRKLGEWPL
jgi:hypothetical protein